MSGDPAATGDTWQPGELQLQQSNLAALIRQLGVPDYDAFLELSVQEPERYWQATLQHLGIVFDPPAQTFLDVSEGQPWARFFVGAGFNFAAACVEAPADAAGRFALSWEDEAGASGCLTYPELQARTRRFAAGLRRLGVQAGDRVGLLFPNTAEAVISFLAIGYIGAISVPLYSGFGEEAVVKRLLDAEARCLVTAEGFVRRGRHVQLAKLAAVAKERVPSLESVVVVRHEGAPAPAFEHQDWNAVERSGGEGAAPHRTAANDPFMVIYTSGTSGRPKGAVHVHGGFPLRVAQDVAFLFDFRPGERYFWMSDMGWMVGPFSICSVLLNKGTLVLYDGAPDAPDIGRLRAVAARHGVTHFGSSPTAVRAMAADEGRALATDAAALRVLMTGGEVMDTDAYHWYFEKFGRGRLPIINYTGGTEVSGAILTNVVLRRIAPSRFNSTAPGVRGAVVDGATGQPVVGVPGELAIAQPFVGMTRGFWRDPERYLDTYWSRLPNLWVHGDLVVEEADGQYLLLGRSDDVMKIAGKRVGPAEIEGLVADGAMVGEAVAFGVPDSRSGEALVVLAVPSAQEDPTQLEPRVVARLRTEMGPAFKPQAVVAVPRLAKTRNGKLVRRLARQAWLEEPAGDLSAIEDVAVFDEMVEACRRYREAHGIVPSAPRTQEPDL